MTFPCDVDVNMVDVDMVDVDMIFGTFTKDHLADLSPWSCSCLVFKTKHELLLRIIFSIEKSVQLG